MLSVDFDINKVHQPFVKYLDVTRQFIDAQAVLETIVPKLLTAYRAKIIAYFNFHTEFVERVERAWDEFDNIIILFDLFLLNIQTKHGVVLVEFINFHSIIIFSRRIRSTKYSV